MMHNHTINTMKKMALPFVAAVAIAICLIPTTAEAVERPVTSEGDLRGAFNQFESGDVIKLKVSIPDFGETIPPLINIDHSNAKDITLDLNGQTIAFGDEGSKSESFIEHEGSGLLSIIDSKGGGSIEGGPDILRGVISLKGNSKVKLSGVKITNNRVAVYCNEAGELTIENSTIISNGSTQVGQPALSAGSFNVTISGSTIESKGQDGIGIFMDAEGGGTLKFTGPSTVKGTQVAIKDIVPTFGKGLVAKASSEYSGNSLETFVPDSMGNYRYISIQKVPVDPSGGDKPDSGKSAKNVDVPNTGDDLSLGIWIGLTGIGAIGIVVNAMLYYVRKRLP